MKSKAEHRSSKALIKTAAAAPSSSASAAHDVGAIGNRAMQSLLGRLGESTTTASSALPSGPGRPLEPGVRLEMEQRLGHAFDDVRVHTGRDADASANAFAADAYTLGKDVVFAHDAYAPNTATGKKLLAHELAHVVQQRGTRPNPGSAQVVDDPLAEREADAVAQSLDRAPSVERPAIRRRAERPHIARQAKAAEFPGFSQKDFVTCGAASLVTAIMIWDRERKSASEPNRLLIAACNAVLVYLDDRKTEVIQRLDKLRLGGNAGEGEIKYRAMRSGIESVRNNALVAGTPLTELDYRVLSASLYLLYKDDNAGGLTRSKIQSVQGALGISATKSENGDTFDAIMDKLVDLKPGQIAQVAWYSRGPVQADGTASFTDHAFLVGRFQRGAWFVSDQGDSPPTEIEAPDLLTLKDAIKANTKAKNGGIHTGGIPTQKVGDMEIAALNLDKGVMILGDRSGIETKARNVVMKPGEFIAEVDASSLRGGDRIVAWDFVARSYTLADAQKELNGAGTGSGGVIVENPIGLFHVFKTSLVEDHNLMETAIDESDSAGGKLAPKPKLYYHAWLQLRSKNATGAFFKVY